ncbi:MAG: hypothetical protein AAEJ59_11420 [Arenicellales bacterium]|nr:hypothetical protein [Arenicellales bacterium]
MASSCRLTSKAPRADWEFAGDTVFQLSVGLEDLKDLCQDLARAFD